jgi:ubiquitin-like-specific protease 1C/D
MLAKNVNNIHLISCQDEQNSLFTKLRRWWKDTNIFEKAYIILPIHGR